MKFLHVITFSISTITCSAQIYEIPNADEQPAWVFPLWFEDANGTKDSIYIAYDEEAVDYGISTDVVFGEDLQEIDTDTFNVTWGFLIGDEGLKVLVWKTITNPEIITFINAKLPLKITWDNNLFYSTELPFSNNFPLPTMWGSVHCGENYFEGCQETLEGVIIITDTPDYDYWSDFATDSLWFNSEEYTYFANYLDFKLLQYGEVQWGEVKPNIPSVEVVPSITNSFVNVHAGPMLSISLVDLSGNLVKIIDLNNSTDCTISIADLLPGLYFLIINGHSFSYSTKIIKL